MAGAVLGVLVQSIFPNWLYLSVAAIVLGFTSYKTFQKYHQVVVTQQEIDNSAAATAIEGDHPSIRISDPLLIGLTGSHEQEQEMMPPQHQLDNNDNTLRHRSHSNEPPLPESRIPSGGDDPETSMPSSSATLRPTLHLLV